MVVDVVVMRPSATIGSTSSDVDGGSEVGDNGVNYAVEISGDRVVINRRRQYWL